MRCCSKCCYHCVAFLVCVCVCVCEGVSLSVSVSMCCFPACGKRRGIVMCGKLKFGSGLVSKNRTVQKFDIRSDGFPMETAYSLPFK